MSEADDPITYLKYKAGDIIIRKYLGPVFADIWGVVSFFLGQEESPEVQSYRVELSELSVDESAVFFKHIARGFRAVGRGFGKAARFIGRGVRAAGRFLVSQTKKAYRFVKKGTQKFVAAVGRHATRLRSTVGRWSQAAWRGVRNAAQVLAKGARALGKIIAAIAGQLAASCGTCANIGTNAVYAIIRHVIPNEYKRNFKHIK